MSRPQRIRSAAEHMARAAFVVERRLLGAGHPWEQLHPKERELRTVAMIGVLRHCSEDILDALLGVGPDRRGKRPQPSDLAVLIEDTRVTLSEVMHDYGYLHSSGYSPPRGGGRKEAQQTEDEQWGDGDSDLGSGMGRRLAIGRCLDAAADRVMQIRRLALGAKKALGDLAAIIDEATPDEMAEVEAIPSAEALENERQGKAAQKRREGRAHKVEWQGERAG